MKLYECGIIICHKITAVPATMTPAVLGCVGHVDRYCKT
jgi:hypothetical protein